ncbi:hypothetical protein FRC07_001317 [Ceratobasidium sp. 392]|nr:hypothetical protein FRC07_001317 [Ceratobasidium sp. 392]
MKVITGLVTDAHGNPTTDHSASAIGGTPGYGVHSDKTPAHLAAISSNAPPKATDPIPVGGETRTEIGNGTTEPGKAAATRTGVFTDAQGNPTTDPNASALEGTPAFAIPARLVDQTSSTVTTPGVQLPGGWIRGAESRQNSTIGPETSLYEDVSAALGTVGQAAFSALPASVIGNFSHNHQAKSPADTNVAAVANVAVAENDTEAATKQPPPSPPARTGTPGLLSRAQGVLSGFLARPASPAAKLPAPDAPTTTGEAALVGGGAIASTANELGTNISSAQNPDLGGHEPKGVLEGNGDANLHSEGTARRTGLPEGANTAARFMNPDIATPDPNKPPQDPGLSGSVFPVLADDPPKDKGKTKPTPAVGSTLSTDADVQAAAHKSNQNFSAPVVGAAGVTGASKPDEVSETDRPQPTVTKVSDSGVKGRLLDVRDVVAAPFAGSRAPKSDEEPQSPGKDAKTPEPGMSFPLTFPFIASPGVANVDQSTKTSANAEGIRTTENPHTARTELAPAREDGTHIGGTGVADHKTRTGGVDGKNLDGTVAGAGIGSGAIGTGLAGVENGTTGDKTIVDAHGNVIHIPGISLRGQGQGRIITGEDGGIRSADAPHVEHKDKEAKSNVGGSLSRLLSRSRTSVDATHGRRASVDDASKSPKRAKSRFNEEPPAASEPSSTPTSPSSSRFKVPLKDKIKGELKIISGKMSRNEAKVEQGIALKTGHASDAAVSPVNK